MGVRTRRGNAKPFGTLGSLRDSHHDEGRTARAKDSIPVVPVGDRLLEKRRLVETGAG